MTLEHYSAEQRRKIIDSYPAHEREARTKGAFRSILHYVRAAGALNRVALKINDYSSQSLSKGSNPLLGGKNLEERQGRGGWERLVPLESVLENDECYSFGLSGTPKHGCVGEILFSGWSMRLRCADEVIEYEQRT